MAISSINANSTVFNVIIRSQDDASCEKFSLCCVVCQVEIPAHTQVTVLVSCQGARLTKIETKGNVVECQCSLTPRDLMYTLPGKLFYVYIVNMTARLVNLLKFMIVAYLSSAPAWIICARDDGPHVWTNECPIQTKWDTFNSSPTINAVRYRRFEPCNEQVDFHNAVKQSDEVLNTDWRKKLTLTVSILHIVTKSLTGLHSSAACGTGPLVGLRLCRTKLNLKWRITDLLSQIHTAQGLGG